MPLESVHKRTSQDLSGRTALVTGANTGIGRETATDLALRGAHVFLACRSQQRTEPVLRDIAEKSGGKAQAEFLPLDLGDVGSVHQCASLFLSRELPLHILINNAGLAGQKGFTASGFELAFGTCHVGHFLLTQLLLDCLKRSAPARVVVVASRAHRHTKEIDFQAVRQPTRSRTGLAEYGVAKLANILFTAELAWRLKGTGVTTYAVHPGVVGSDVWRSIPRPLDNLIKRFMLSPEQGAATSLYCATDAGVATESGLYYDKCRVTASSPLSRDPELARRLWVETENWLRAK